MTLLAEDLVLLLLDDETGSFTAGDALETGIGGALLAELALLGAVEVGGGSRRRSKATVRAVPGAQTADPVLADALALVLQKDRTATSLVGRMGKGTKGVLLERLVDRGMVERHEDKVLGLFPRTRWPAVDSAHEERVRAELVGVLAGERAGPRAGALIALLHAMGAAHKVLSVPGLSAGDLRRRAKEIAEGDWAAQAVKDAVQAAQSAVATTIAAAGAATAAGGS
ncbi:GPP34 family phosphoprotein [Georgenia sp. 10Sc9-8]|uniref:GPP34 family phosphoprotein n=1 Tax=Georgenia halotolerans TaxID=3028317 RepID=A0ABT5TXS5_9MICO|nr:GPP34 family phosphoprotein [Georgenia halotolerans]